MSAVGYVKTFLTRPHHTTVMAAYDSDSSLDHQTEYKDTSVLLGYASNKPTDDLISHLGGLPACASCHSFLSSDADWSSYG